MAVALLLWAFELWRFGDFVEKNKVIGVPQFSIPSQVCEECVVGK